MIRNRRSLLLLSLALLAGAPAARSQDAPTIAPPATPPAAPPAAPEHDLLPTPITLHVHDMPIDQVLQQIAPQAKIKTQSQGNNSSTVTLDADGKPFWSVLVDACNQAHCGVQWTYGGQPAGRLLYVSPQPMGEAVVSGPVLAQFKSINHSQRMNETPEARDHCEIAVELSWEPRLDVLFFDTLSVPTEATDEAGHSLLPTTPVTISQRNGSSSFGNFRAAHEQGYMTEARHIIALHPPAQAGRKIAHLVGDIRLFITGEEKSMKIEDLQAMGKSKATYKFVKDSALKVNSASVRDNGVSITFQCAQNAGESDDAWHQRAMLLSASEYELFTADGDAWSSSRIKVNLGWGGNSVYLSLNAARLPNVSDPPKTLVLRAAEDAKQFNVHYDLKDLPLP